MSSDEQSTDVSRSDDEISASEDSNEDDRRALIDDEAEESDEGSDGTLDGDYDPEYSFSKFMELPPELRHRIWELFCPDLTVKSRVLQFTILRGGPPPYRIYDHFSLADQTEAARSMLACHQESRNIAVKAFPDELPFAAGSGDALVRFNKDTDVIRLPPNAEVEIIEFEREFSSRVANLAMGHGPEFDPLDEALARSAKVFPNLKTVYVTCSYAHLKERQLSTRSLRWCTSDYVHRYMVETYEKEPGLGEDTETLFCWPNVDAHPDFAKYSTLREKLFSEDDERGAQKAGVSIWPMVVFELDKGMALYRKLEKLKDVPLLEGSDDESSADEDDDSEDSSEPNEYESEGIDDDEIIEVDDSSDEDILDDATDAGRFSSVEPDDEAPRRDEIITVDRRRKRKIVLESDEEEEDDEPQAKRARMSRAVVDSDDDVVETRSKVNGHAVVVDSDDESDEEDGSVQKPRARRRRVASESEEEEDENQGEGTEESSEESGESDDDDDGGEPQRVSLAERLRQTRRDNPLSSESDGGSEDEEDDEDDDEDDEGGGLLDIMADEEEDEEDSEGEW